MWRVHPGTVMMANDLLVVNLGEPSAGTGDEPVFHISIYDVAYSLVGSGHVAFVRYAGAEDEALRRGFTLTDTPELARFLIGRLSTTGWAGVDTSIVPRRARFRRSPMGQQVDVAISAPNLELRIVWKEFGPQRWTEGVSKSYPLERAWAFFVEAQQVIVTLNGRTVDATPYPDERYRSMFGEPISSCQIGLCEIHLRPRRLVTRRPGATGSQTRSTPASRASE